MLDRNLFCAHRRPTLGVLAAVLVAILIGPGGCGGGSNGTGIGPNPGQGVSFSGLVISRAGKAVDSATVTLLNTGDRTITDEAGAFDLRTDFPGGDAALSIDSGPGDGATVSIDNISTDAGEIGLSILFDSETNSATLLDLTLRARIVRSCSPQFLNTQTVKQTSVVPDGFVCTVETEIKSDGTLIDNQEFELDFRGCSKNDEWHFLARGRTGTSGPGAGEIDFAFHADQEHCVYRILGPRNVAGVPRLSAQINTLLKQDFDRHNSEKERALNAVAPRINTSRAGGPTAASGAFCGATLTAHTGL